MPIILSTKSSVEEANLNLGIFVLLDTVEKSDKVE